LPVIKKVGHQYANSFFGFSLAFSDKTTDIYVGAPKFVQGSSSKGRCGAVSQKVTKIRQNLEGVSESC
jgi:hypothetical protein